MSIDMVILFNGMAAGKRFVPLLIKCFLRCNLVTQPQLNSEGWALVLLIDTMRRLQCVQ